MELKALSLFLEGAGYMPTQQQSPDMQVPVFDREEATKHILRALNPQRCSHEEACLPGLNLPSLLTELQPHGLWVKA